MQEPIDLRSPTEFDDTRCDMVVVRSLIGAISLRDLRDYLDSKADHPAGSVRRWTDPASPLPSS